MDEDADLEARSARQRSQQESAKLTDFYSSVISLVRWCEAEEQAKAVLFLASDDSWYINAVELVVDGGSTGARFRPPSFAANAAVPLFRSSIECNSIQGEIAP
jgi:NAD(P)-dependent dehydrogenase (short-subunit alcohol dehydrogenase family)